MPDFKVVVADWTQQRDALARVRRAVFIEEQGVPEEMEWDRDDGVSTHWLAVDAHGNPIGCARLLPDGHVGRMAVLPDWRRRGVGAALLAAVTTVARARGDVWLRLSAQTHAVGFYTLAGFERVGREYEEAGIPHIEMRKRLTEHKE